MNRQIETGVNRGGETFQIPRDKRGRVRWKILGASPEDNERLGINNIQAIFLERFPAFNYHYPRGEDGFILENKREEAKMFILKQIGRVADFKSVFGGSYLNKHVAAYFEGSHVLALKKSFASWGVSIDLRYRGYWTDENIRREALLFLDEKGEISHNKLKLDNRGDLSHAIYHSYTGGMVKLREDLGIVSRIKKRNFWTEATIEEEATKVYVLLGHFSSPVLKERGFGNLLQAIKKRYPGGIRALRDKLGIEWTRKPHRYWTNERVEIEALDFYKREGALSNALLLERGLYSLSIYIGKYPGGLRGLREKLGISAIRVRKEESISPDEANKQLRGLLEQKNE